MAPLLLVMPPFKPNVRPHWLPTLSQSLIQKPLGASGLDLLYARELLPQYDVKDPPLTLV